MIIAANWFQKMIEKFPDKKRWQEIFFCYIIVVSYTVPLGRLLRGKRMGHYEKLYAAIANSPNNVRFDDLCNLLTKVGGFECHPGKGDHYNFSHPDLVEILTVDSRGKNKPLRPIYVRKALKAFRQVKPVFPEEE